MCIPDAVELVDVLRPGHTNFELSWTRLHGL